jgi:TorA maturation chaperone TorD
MNANLLDGLSVRAAIYEMLAIGFGYPDAVQRARMRSLSRALAPWLDLIHPDWTDHVQAFEDALAATSDDEIEAEFNVLFSGAMECAPFESAYERDIFRKQHALADVAGFYRAFGFDLGEASRWQPDYVGVQLEFCSIVLQRTGEAIADGLEEESAVCVDALRKFLLDHLGRWVEAFTGDVASKTRIPYYRGLAELTRKWLDLELRALDLEPDRLSSRHRFAEDAALPNCGGCTTCPPGQPITSCSTPLGAAGPVIGSER